MASAVHKRVTKAIRPTFVRGGRWRDLCGHLAVVSGVLAAATVVGVLAVGFTVNFWSSDVLGATLIAGLGGIPAFVGGAVLLSRLSKPLRAWRRSHLEDHGQSIVQLFETMQGAGVSEDRWAMATIDTAIALLGDLAELARQIDQHHASPEDQTATLEAADAQFDLGSQELTALIDEAMRVAGAHLAAPVATICKPEVIDLLDDLLLELRARRAAAIEVGIGSPGAIYRRVPVPQSQHPDSPPGDAVAELLDEADLEPLMDQRARTALRRATSEIQSLAEVRTALRERVETLPPQTLDHLRERLRRDVDAERRRIVEFEAAIHERLGALEQVLTEWPTDQNPAPVAPWAQSDLPNIHRARAAREALRGGSELPPF